MKFRFKFIPKTADTVKIENGGLGEVYTYSLDGKLYAVAYAGKQSKPTWHFRFQSEQRRAEKIADFWRGLESHKARIAERRMERAVPHSIKVGTLVYNSWGYDQTNVDIYAVVKTSDHYVWLYPVAQDMRETGFMQGYTRVASPFRLCPRKLDTGEYAPPEKHMVTMWNGAPSVHFDHGCGSVLRDGRELWCSWYA